MFFVKLHLSDNAKVSKQMDDPYLQGVCTLVGKVYREFCNIV